MNLDVAGVGQLPITFADGFFERYAGSIVRDQKVAMTEIVANAWDAGANHVTIDWPDGGGLVKITDDGTGMTVDEFRKRWGELSYNRLLEQGPSVQFPQDNARSTRTAFGRNGLGRHSMFVFNVVYHLRTWQGGKGLAAVISKLSGETPLGVNIVATDSAVDGHGTELSVQADDSLLPSDEIAKYLTSRFIADPSFTVSINGTVLTMQDLSDISETFEVEVEGLGIIEIMRFDAEGGRTSQQTGVAFWVKNRLVGSPSWNAMEGAMIDRREAIAKRYIYVVKADLLDGRQKPDWSGFYSDETVENARKIIYARIREDLVQLSATTRNEKTKQALEANGEGLRKITRVGRDKVSTLIQELLEKSPTLSTETIKLVVQVMVNLEASRTGYGLLNQIAEMDHEDVDKLYALLGQWSVVDIKTVMDELDYRVQFIKELETLIVRGGADELHELQPVFEKALWIFGPEMESKAFLSNRTLANVLRELLKDREMEGSSKRPDFVILPDASLGVYAQDGFSSNGEANGFEKIMIIELKKGDYKVGSKEMYQAQGYAHAIRKSGQVGTATAIVCRVIGSAIDDDAREPMTQGNTSIYSNTYAHILRMANARTFHLMDKLKKFSKELGIDPDEESVQLEAAL